MRIDINLRLKICGIDASLNRIIATKLKTPNKEERATHIFFHSKNLSETEGCTGKAREWPQKNSSWKESERLLPNSISQCDYRLQS